MKRFTTDHLKLSLFFRVCVCVCYDQSLCFYPADWVLGLLWITGQLIVTESPDYLFSGCGVFHHAASALYRYIAAEFPEKLP